MIIFEDVAFRYTDSEESILHDVNFTLESGSYHFLSGPSGSGKTSLMKLIYLSALPTAGKITMFDRKIHTLSREELFKMRQRIGVVFQDFRLLNHLSAFDNVALPLRVARRPNEEVQTHVTELLDWVGLGDCKDKLPRMLSGGQQQRIAIARAVITQPKLLLADEPTGNLDDEIGYRLMGLFEQLNRMGTTIVIATHNASIIEQFGHPCLRLTKGAIHQEKPKAIGRIRNVF